jgi:hypothetical protein
VPFGETPVELPWLLPEVEGDEPELDEPELGASELGEPAFGVALPVVPAVFGKFPQGEPLGLVPGGFELFGFTVEGWVLLPGVAGFVEFEPGTLDGEPGVAVPACGVAVPAGGVAELAGGVAVFAGGVAVPGA